ncbi:MAG: nucleotidyltransferase family protein [Terracidiphilus sp.]
MSTQGLNTAPRSGCPDLRLRAAILRSFSQPFPEECLRLCYLSSSEWQRLLRWLDTSGLALYFLHRLSELRLTCLLPSPVLARLERNLADNSERTRKLMDESSSIQRDFQGAGLSYAVLKGFSLCPASTPRPELRSQLDLDFLIAERCAPTARQILEQRGYRLHAISGRSWEFKTTGPPARSIADLYKPSALRCVELHLEFDRTVPSLLARTEWRDFHGISMPVLSGPDLFLGQALHLFKHVSSEFWRTAHLLELYRHIDARRHDAGFWRSVRSIAGEAPRTLFALGVDTQLIACTISDLLPEDLVCSTVERLPPRARRWVEIHGCNSAFSNFPGSKLYLLLQRELESAGVPRKRSMRQSLLPLRLPPPIALAPAKEPLSARIRRWRAQFRFVLFRLHFHIVEGVRYFRESLRWRRLADKPAS